MTKTWRMPVRNAISTALLDALALVSPIECAGCGTPDRPLCLACRAALAPRIVVRKLGDLDVTTALEYDGQVRRILLALKESGRTDVARALASPMRAAISACAPGRSAELALVPASAGSLRRRGYDPLKLLVGRTAIASRVLAHSRSTAAQKTLSIDDRATNLRGAFVARRDLTGRRFVVADDILTSGATMEEAVRALRDGGAEVIAGVALAFTPRLLRTRDIADGEDYRGRKGAS